VGEAQKVLSHRSKLTSAARSELLDDPAIVNLLAAVAA